LHQLLKFLLEVYEGERREWVELNPDIEIAVGSCLTPSN
jgi:hypothetical protein